MQGGFGKLHSHRAASAGRRGEFTLDLSSGRGVRLLRRCRPFPKDQRHNATMKFIALLIIAAALLYGTARLSNIHIGERAAGGHDGTSATAQERFRQAEKQAQETAEAARRAALRDAE